MTGRQIDVFGYVEGGKRGGPPGPTAALLKLHLPDCRAFQLPDTRTDSITSSASNLVLIQAEAVLILFVKHTLA